jgi:hypothetical protein
MALGYGGIGGFGVGPGGDLEDDLAGDAKNVFAMFIATYITLNQLTKLGTFKSKIKL